MTTKFIRAFFYGIEEGETVTVSINGKDVDFTVDSVQQDIEITVAPEAGTTGETQ